MFRECPETPRLKAYWPNLEILDEYATMLADADFIACYGVNYDHSQAKQRLLNDIAHFEKYGFGMWTWRDKASGKYVGRGGLRHLEIAGKNEVELGYAIKKEYWAQGLATEIGQASIAFAFDVCGLQDLVCFTLASNSRSLAVMKKLGFIYEKDFVHADLPHKLHRLKAA